MCGGSSDRDVEADQWKGRLFCSPRRQGRRYLSFEFSDAAGGTRDGGLGGEANLSFCFTHPSVSTFATNESSAEPPPPPAPHFPLCPPSPLQSPPTRLAAERDLCSSSSSPISHALHPRVPSGACGSLPSPAARARADLSPQSSCVARASGGGFSSVSVQSKCGCKSLTVGLMRRPQGWWA